MSACPPYHAPRWLHGAHAQTIWPLLIKGPLPPLLRERWETPDGDFIDLDFLPWQSGKPLVVMFHGLEGSSRSHYTRALLRALWQHGWNGVVPHFRGCSGEPNRKLRAYHSGDADEIDWILRRLAARASGAAVHASGVSLGGNALLVWLAREGAGAGVLLSSAAAICAPLDLALCAQHLAQGFNRLYTRHFLRSMKPSARAKLARFPGSFDARHLEAAQDLIAFDDLLTAPLHGFSSAADYYRRASAKPGLVRIRLPTLLLNSRNDPFVPPTALPHAQQLSPSITQELPTQGGHVGFVSGAFPGHLEWLPQRLLHFFQQH